MRIEPSTYQAVAHLRSRAAREQVSISDTRETRWLAVRVHATSAAIGCAAVLRQGARARVKAVYLHPQFRGEGTGRALMDAAVQLARDSGAEEIEVFAARPTGWARYDLTQVGVRPNGVVTLRGKA